MLDVTRHPLTAVRLALATGPGLRAAGIAHRRVNDLRHTYASWSLARDVPAPKLAKMMGTSIGQIEDTYHRFLKSDEERYGSALDGYEATG